MAVAQPRVARNEQLWVGVAEAANSERVEPDFPPSLDSTLSELAQRMMPQGRRCCANPGLSDRNPFGVAANPFGVAADNPFIVNRP